MEECQHMQEYLDSLNDKDRKALEIAKSQLGSSFNIEKSIGFIHWMKAKNAK